MALLLERFVDRLQNGFTLVILPKIGRFVVTSLGGAAGWTLWQP